MFAHPGGICSVSLQLSCAFTLLSVLCRVLRPGTIPTPPALQSLHAASLPPWQIVASSGGYFSGRPPGGCEADDSTDPSLLQNLDMNNPGKNRRATTPKNKYLRRRVLLSSSQGRPPRRRPILWCWVFALNYAAPHVLLLPRARVPLPPPPPPAPTYPLHFSWPLAPVRDP